MGTAFGFVSPHRARKSLETNDERVERAKMFPISPPSRHSDFQIRLPRPGVWLVEND